MESAIKKMKANHENDPKIVRVAWTLVNYYEGHPEQEDILKRLGKILFELALENDSELMVDGIIFGMNNRTSKQKEDKSQ